VATLSRERGIVIVVLLPLANIVVRHGAAWKASHGSLALNYTDISIILCIEFESNVQNICIIENYLLLDYVCRKDSAFGAGRNEKRKR
jgi:hypothetical protein